MSEQTAERTLQFNPESRISLPVAFLVSILALCAISYAAWATTREQVTRNTNDIVEIKKEQQATWEILIRIDENVKQLKKAANN